MKRTKTYDIQVACGIDKGSLGTDSDPSNPLSRAISSPFMDGSPQERLSLCFYGNLDNDSLDVSSHKWLGVFVFSAGRRVIFFPGLTFNPTWVSVSRAKSPHRRHDIDIDHISLENSFRRWHFSSRRTRHKMPN